MLVVRPKFGDWIAIYDKGRMIGTLKLTQGNGRVGIAFDFPRDVKIDAGFRKQERPTAFVSREFEVPPDADN